MISFLRLHTSWPIICLAGGDILVLFGAITAGLSLRYTTLGQIFTLDSPYLLQALIFVTVIAAFLSLLGAFRKQTLRNLKTLTIIIFLSHILSFASLTIIFYAFPSTRIWLSTLIPALLLSLSGTFVLHLLFDRFIAFRRFRRKILVLGAGKTASRIAKLMRTGQAPMTHCVGFVPIENAPVKVPTQDLLPREKPLTELIAEQNVDEVVVALDERRDHLPVEILLECRLRGVQISEFSTFLEREAGCVELDSLYPSWMVFASGFTAATGAQRLIKRAFDVLACLILLTLAFPLFVASALAILVEDSGSIFYRQERVGLNGRRFKLLKFRSMRKDAEGDGEARWAGPDDPRVTVVGRLLRRIRIDELPQIYNVLRGDMSLIGPRPERPEFVDQLEAEIPYYDFRHSIKPGISGWAQINYPYGASIQDSKEKLKYDLYYIKNYSLLLDLLVLLQTIRVVIWPDMVRQMEAHASWSEVDEESRSDRARSTS